MSRAKSFPAHGPELRALLVTCHAHPDDDTARLVLADWLQERDDPRGELVRAQVRLNALPATAHAEYDKLFAYHRRWMKKYLRRWDAEADNFIWHFGPHNRGLPLVGYPEDSDHFWIDPRRVGERLAATIAQGWPELVWLVPELDDDGPFAFLREPPFAGSPTPIGIVLTEDGDVRPAVLKALAEVPNLRGLALWEGWLPQRSFQYVAALTGLHHLALGETPLTDTQAKQLTKLTELRSLSAPNAHLEYAGARALGKFAHLRELALSCIHIDAPGFRAISESAGIEVLDLTAVGNDDLDALRGLSRLRDLRLPAGLVTGVGFENFPLLTELRLDSAEITDAGMQCLAALPRLQFLDLTNARGVTGEILKHLSGAKWLEYLHASNTAIRDEHLPALHGLKHLHTINLDGTQVTKKGLARLREALPKADVYGGS